RDDLQELRFTFRGNPEYDTDARMLATDVPRFQAPIATTRNGRQARVKLCRLQEFGIEVGLASGGERLLNPGRVVAWAGPLPPLNALLFQPRGRTIGTLERRHEHRRVPGLAGLRPLVVGMNEVTGIPRRGDQRGGRTRCKRRLDRRPDRLRIERVRPL